MSWVVFLDKASPSVELGYMADEKGRFDWAEPDEEVHSFVNDLERDVGIYPFGRRMAHLRYRVST